jgi:Activator of Hsp90 ATPase homolog 1-like protein
MDFKEIIEIGDHFAKAELVYPGTPSLGMLAWLDSSEVKVWSKADSVIIDPAAGGMYYLAWGESSQGAAHAIYGVLEGINTVENTIDISKLLYISPIGKMAHMHLKLRFVEESTTHSRVIIIHSHQFSGEMKEAYDRAVHNAWPPSFALFLKYMQRNSSAA